MKESLDNSNKPPFEGGVLNKGQNQRVTKEVELPKVGGDFYFRHRLIRAPRPGGRAPRWSR